MSCFQVKTLAGLEAIEWIFLAISIINVLVAFALNIDRLVEIPKNWPDYTFAIIVFINIGTYDAFIVPTKFVVVEGFL